jgi:cell division protein FtsL
MNSTIKTITQQIIAQLTGQVMKLKLALLFTLVISTFGISQSTTNTNNNRDFEESEAQLSQVYQQILNEYENDTVFVSRLKETQRILYLFREAELQMKFPEDNKEVFYGSIYRECANQYLIELTEDRIEKLQIWVEGVEEGDVCSGSIKLKAD